MRKIVTISAAIAAIMSGVMVLLLNIAVQEQASLNRTLAKQIHDDREAIRILSAEWNYLTTPRTLEDRSGQFLALMPLRAKQIVNTPATIPLRPRGQDVDTKGASSVVLSSADKPRKAKKNQRKGTAL